MSECQDRGLVRDPVGDQGDAGKAGHRRYLNQRILHRWIAQFIPLLQEIDPQNRLQRIGRPATLGADRGVDRLNQIEEHLPWHNRFHLSQETIAPGPPYRRGLFVITESELLAAHEACPQQRHRAIFTQGAGVFKCLLRRDRIGWGACMRHYRNTGTPDRLPPAAWIRRAAIHAKRGTSSR